jgi:type IV pilus assembly protein PilE
MTVDVNAVSSTSPGFAAAWRGSVIAAARGFTLIEVMIVVAIVAVLAAIALPNYSDYIKRGKIIEATAALSDLRTRYEQYYLDNRTYAGGCLLIKPIVNTARAFDIDCGGESNATYTGTATGKATESMGNFIYTINQANAKVSTITEPGWSGSATCWSIRKDGSCS